MSYRPLAFLFLCIFVLASALQAQAQQVQAIPGKFYEYHIMATSGQTPANATSTLSGMGDSPSINGNGVVAFVGQFSSGGEGVVVADPSSGPALISFAPNPLRFFGRAVQINNLGQVVATDRFSGSPPTYFGRLWDASSGIFNTRLIGNSTGSFAAVLGQASVNNNNDTVFGALDSAATQIELVSVQSNGTTNQIFLPANSLPRPQISDSGKIVVRFGNQTNSAILLYSIDFLQVTAIATPALFNTTGNQPGISADGRIVTFYGDLNAAGATAFNLTPGPGIFASIDEGGTTRRLIRVLGKQVEDLTASGGNKDGICDPGEVCKPAAELGYDAAGNPIFFSSFDPLSRVAVMNLGLTPLPGFQAAAAPIDGNSAVISFVATPSAASRPNPVVPTIPLLFSNQLGIWTVRLDVLQQLSGPTPTRAYHPTTPIPVVQVGDTIGGHVIASFNVFDQIGNAATDNAGNIRTQRRGDHRVVFWAQDSANVQLIIRGSHTDSNQDGLLDFWKTTGIDMDQDGVPDLNLGAMGASLNQRDLFIELDWLAPQPFLTFQPLAGSITPPPTSPGQPSPFIAMFAGAPPLQGTSASPFAYGLRSDGKAPAPIPAGINVHIDAGHGTDAKGRPLSTNFPSAFQNGGNQIGLPGSPGALVEALYFGPKNSVSIPGITSRSLDDIKDVFFGTMDKRARELAFHYAVFGMWRFQNNRQIFANRCLDADPITGQPTNFAVPFSGSGTFDPNTGILLPSSALPNPNCVSLFNPKNPVTGAVVYVKILTGPGQGQYFPIINATSSQLTLGGNLPAGQTPGLVTFALLSTSSGVAELFESPPPDFNSQPGNDVIITLGSPPWQVRTATLQNVAGTACAQWRTLAHELGHNLGLRHGGVDDTTSQDPTSTLYKPNYLSLMNYAYQVPNPCSTSPVQGYSGLNDLVFSDFSNLKHDFTDSMAFLGNSIGLNHLGVATDVPSPTAGIHDC